MVCDGFVFQNVRVLESSRNSLGIDLENGISAHF